MPHPVQQVGRGGHTVDTRARRPRSRSKGGVGQLDPQVEQHVVLLLGGAQTRDNVWRTFVNRVRINLHCVLCMSPVGDSFRIRCRNFAALVNCTTIDWYLPWPAAALAIMRAAGARA